MKLTDELNYCLHRAVSVATANGCNYVSVEHVIVVALKDESSITSQALQDFGVNADNFLSKIKEILGI